MEKWVVNDYILHMRGDVKQARVHILNKLVKMRRMLLTKKGTDDQVKKYHQKAEKLKEEIFCIKKLNIDEISRYALLSTENTPEMLDEVSRSLEERSKMRLASHKSIANQVDIFRAKYPDWALKLPPLLVQLGLMNKYKKIQRMKMKRKKKDCGTSRLNKTENGEKDETSNESINKNKETESFVSNQIDSDNHDGSMHGERGKENKNKENKSCNSNQIESDNDGSILKKKDNKEIKHSNITENNCVSHQINLNIVDDCTDNKKQEKANSDIIQLSHDFEGKKSARIAEVRRFVDLLKLEKYSENSEHSETECSPEKNEVTDSATDFFVRGDEDHENDFISIQKYSENSEHSESECSSEKNEATNSATDPFFLRGDDDGENDDFDSNGGHKITSCSTSSGTFVKRSQYPRFKNTSSGTFSERSLYPSFRRNFSKREMSFSKVDQNVPTMNRKQKRLMMHLQAERKDSITSIERDKLFPRKFESSKMNALVQHPKRAGVHPVNSAVNQGSKMKAFVQHPKRTGVHPVNSAVNLGSKMKAFVQHPKRTGVHPVNSAVNQEVLHPSWEAKRKQRQIAEFQGRKIKFDED